VANACECGNEPSGSVKFGQFLDYLLKKDSAPWTNYGLSQHCFDNLQQPSLHFAEVRLL